MDDLDSVKTFQHDSIHSNRSQGGILFWMGSITGLGVFGHLGAHGAHTVHRWKSSLGHSTVTGRLRRCPRDSTENECKALSTTISTAKKKGGLNQDNPSRDYLKPGEFVGTFGQIHDLQKRADTVKAHLKKQYPENTAEQEMMHAIEKAPGWRADRRVLESGEKIWRGEPRPEDTVWELSTSSKT